MKIFLVNSEYEIKVLIPVSEWGLEFLLSCKGETWSSCSVPLDKINTIF